MTNCVLFFMPLKSCELWVEWVLWVFLQSNLDIENAEHSDCCCICFGFCEAIQFSVWALDLWLRQCKWLLRCGVEELNFCLVDTPHVAGIQVNFHKSLSLNRPMLSAREPWELLLSSGSWKALNFCQFKHGLFFELLRYAVFTCIYVGLLRAQIPLALRTALNWGLLWLKNVDSNENISTFRIHAWTDLTVAACSARPE